jgi:hypothetical protein
VSGFCKAAFSTKHGRRWLVSACHDAICELENVTPSWGAAPNAHSLVSAEELTLPPLPQLSGDLGVGNKLHMATCGLLWAKTRREVHYLLPLFILWSSNIYTSYSLFPFANSSVDRRKLYLLLKRFSSFSGCQVQLERLIVLPRAGLAKSQDWRAALFLL